MAERDSGQPEPVEASGGAGSAAGATSFLERAVIRRRVRFLRRRRELSLHDLGGFVFESHRLGQPGGPILDDKLAALSALDDELATLQRALDLREELAVLYEPGIAACEHCGALNDSAANFCQACGLSVHGARVAGPEAETPAAEALPPAAETHPPAAAAGPLAAPAAAPAAAGELAAVPATASAPPAPAPAAAAAAEPTTEEHEAVTSRALEGDGASAAADPSATPADAPL